MKICIIGAGIGGCSAAYYVRQKLPDSDIIIFDELDRIGGRLYHRQIETITNELGATFFHSVNKHLMKLVEDFNLPTEEYVYPRFGIWNGERIIFTSSRNSFITNLKLLFRYRMTALRLNGLINNAKKRVLKLYQKEPDVYTNLKDLFSTGNINEWISTPFDELLLSMGVSQKFIDEIIEPSTRMIYTQNVNIGSFAGLATLISSDGTPIYKIKGGNATLPQRLVDAARANVLLNNRVQNIEKINGKFIVKTDEISEECDIIILAAPIEQALLDFNFPIPQFEFREYQITSFKLVVGIINPAYFGKSSSEEVPELLMTQNKQNIPFRVLENLGKINDSECLFNLVSVDPISNELLNEMFQNTSKIEDHSWQFSYPKSKAITDYQPIKLFNNFYYINAIESTASTMEASILGAKTVVDLLIQDNQL